MGVCAQAPAEGGRAEGQGVPGDAVRVAARQASARSDPVGEGVAQRAAGRGGEEGGDGRGAVPADGGGVSRASRGAVEGWEFEVEGWVNKLSPMLYKRSGFVLMYDGVSLVAPLCTLCLVYGKYLRLRSRIWARGRCP